MAALRQPIPKLTGTAIALALGLGAGPALAGQSSVSFNVTMSFGSASPSPGGGGGGGAVICRTDPETGLVDCAGGIAPTPVVTAAPYWQWRPILYPGALAMAGTETAGTPTQMKGGGGDFYLGYSLGYRYDSVLGAFSETRLITWAGREYLEMTVGW